MGSKIGGLKNVLKLLINPKVWKKLLHVYGFIKFVHFLPFQKSTALQKMEPQYTIACTA